MKKSIILLVFSLMLSLALPSYGMAQNSDAEKISVVCTIFPQYDWVRQILGDNADRFDLTFLLNNKIDLHNYQPSVEDIVKISTCDLLIYVGGESDQWVDNALKATDNPNRIQISLLDALGEGAKAEQIVEGMEHEHDEGDNHDDDDDHDHDDLEDHDQEEDDHEEHDHKEEAELDEHVWLSLRNAQAFCAVIADALSTLDADNAEEYEKNLIAYVQQLSALDASYQAVVDAAPVKTLLFGDRFPFRYLVDDYGLHYYAAFAGCSAETEASFETIVFLSNKADELSLNNIFVTESADQSIVQTIISNTSGKNQQIQVLDAMQSVTAGDAQNGATYLSIMESNLNVLKEALR